MFCGYYDLTYVYYNLLNPLKSHSSNNRHRHEIFLRFLQD